MTSWKCWGWKVPSSKGVVYVAYGPEAREQCGIALRSLYKVHPGWPVAVISDEPIPAGRGIPATYWVDFPDTDPGARWAKLNVDLLSPWEWTVYWDADTRARYSMAAGWDLLALGWELMLCPTGAQEEHLFRHILALEIDGKGEEEKQATIEEVGGRPILALQGGALWFQKCDAIHRFFEVWREEWKRWSNQDQAALIRAMRRAAPKTLLLSRDWNGGSLMGHYHSRARRAGLQGHVR